MSASTRFEENMTDEQIAVYHQVLVEVEKDYLYCDEQYKRAKAARVKLPATNERGTSVVHGANMVAIGVANYWLNRRDSNKRFLSKEFAKKHEINLNFVEIW